MRRVRRSRSSARKGTPLLGVQLLTASIVFGMLGASCAVPGQQYLVAPPIRGSIRGVAPPEMDSALRLVIMSRDAPTLYDAKTVAVPQSRRFQFDPVYIAVAGREYGKRYRVFLHYRTGAADRVIWRGEFSRRELSPSIDLDCDLARPPRLGQPCRVLDPLGHPWLIANGERTFKRLCAECHDPAGQARSIGPRLDLLAARREGRFDRDEVAEWIEGSVIPREHGSSVMPIWGERLSAEKWRYSNADELVGASLDPVIVFLMSIQEDRK